MTTPSSDRLVLFGDDGSAGADVAWLWLNSHRWADWSLDVLQAEMPPIGPPPPPEETEPHEVESPRRAPFDEASFDAVRFFRCVADPRVALLRETSLLVVGASSERVGPLHLGSTTEWLLHDPPAPLVIAKSGQVTRRVLVAADGSPHAAEAARAFARLPWSTDAEVTVLAVDDGRTDADAASRRIADLLVSAEIRTTAATTTGKPHKAVLERAEGDDIDLVVLGTRGLTPLRRLALGSTAAAIARRGAQSILVAHHRGDSD